MDIPSDHVLPMDPSLLHQTVSAPKEASSPDYLVWNRGFGLRRKSSCRVEKELSGSYQIISPEWVDPGHYVLIGLAGKSSRQESGSDSDAKSLKKILGRVVACHPIDQSPEYKIEAKALVTLRERFGYFMDWFIPWLALIACIVAVFNVALLKEENVQFFWYQPVANFYGILVSVYIISRIALSTFYRPPVLNGYRPSVTAVICCKNEEDSIRKTIECLYQCDYPEDKLQVIAVDDGSTDRTLEEMERTRENHPSLKIISFERNLGKRHGMAAGAYEATGEIILYVDSDSFLHRDAIRRMVSGFKDPEVGAVCGHARVHNANKNMLTKMQEVRYYTAFRVVKASESLFSAVTCCSGCLAAYRREYVMTFLDQWLDQTFLGAPATFGDDRSMTNNMLRRYKVLYHSEAVCETIVPESMKTFLRQQIRWKKSWIRESLRAWKFMWRKHPATAFPFYFGTIFPLVAPLVVSNALVLPLLGLGNFSLLYVYGAVLMTILYGLVYLGKHRNGLWVYGILFSIFYMAVLVWLTYYALFTLRKNHWGTR